MASDPPKPRSQGLFLEQCENASNEMASDPPKPCSHGHVSEQCENVSSEMASDPPKPRSQGHFPEQRRIAIARVNSHKKSHSNSHNNSHNKSHNNRRTQASGDKHKAEIGQENGSPSSEHGLENGVKITFLHGLWSRIQVRRNARSV